MTVVDVRGCSGSGKSHLVRQLLALRPGGPVTERGRPIGRFIPELNLAVAGLYRPGVQTAGCDEVKDIEEVTRRLRVLGDAFDNLLFEGLLVSHSYKRFRELAEEFERRPGRRYVFAFLDTPLNLCVRRVRRRREKARGFRFRPFDPKWLLGDWRGTNRVRRCCEEGGQNVAVLDHRDPLPALLSLLGLTRRGPAPPSHAR